VGLRGLIVQHFEERLGVTRDERLTYMARMAGLPEDHELASSKDLPEEALGAILRDVEKCADIGELRAMIYDGVTPGDDVSP
jgi:hypothetical protein